MSNNDTITTEINSKKKMGISSLLSNRGVLIVFSSNFFGNTYVIDSINQIVGRSSKCDIIISDKLISKEHCRVLIDENSKFFIEDLGSTNKTFVNGKELKKKVQLNYGDRIVLGETILRFFIEEKLEK